MTQDVYSPAQLYLHWRERRETYPKWEVFPAKNHSKLEYDSLRGDRRAMQSLQELPAPVNLLLLRELVWKHTLFNAPLEPALLQMVTDQLHIFMPSITNQPAVDGQFTTKNITSLKIPAEWTPDGKEEPLVMSTLRPIWLELAFAALTSHRLYLNVKEFTEWSTLLRDHLHLDHFPVWEAQWHWEGVRLSIDLLNLEEAESRIESWPPNLEDPFWDIRRAAALGELGLTERARGIFSSALERLRAGFQPGEASPRLLSQFAWALRLRWFLNDWQEKALPELEEGIEDKEGLWRLGIDTWADIGYWKSKLSERYGEVSNAAVKQEFRRKFDVGKGIRTFTVNSSNEAQGDPLLAVQFLRFLEWAGYPLMVGGRTFGTKEIQPALLLLSHPYTYPLAVLLTIRIADENTLNGLMSRERIAVLPDEQVNLLVDTLFVSIKQAVSKAAGTGVNLRDDQFHLVNHVLQLGVEALSRLLLRVSDEQIQEALNLALQLAKLPAVQLDWDFYEPVSSLITRSLDRWTPDRAQELVADLAAFPFPQGDNFTERWPIPLHHPLFNALRRATTARWVPSHVVDHLIELVNRGSDHHRRLASLTLYQLFKMNALNEKEAKRYGDALWHRVDERSNLPVHTGLYEFAVVNIPTSKGMETSARFKNYYLENILFNSVLDSEVIRSRGGSIQELDDGLMSLLGSLTRHHDEQSLPLEWSNQETELLFLNVKKWWVSWEKYIGETFEHPRQFHTERLERITQIIVQVLHKLILLRPAIEAEPIREFSELIQARMNDWGFTVTPESQENRHAAAENVILNLLSNSDQVVERAIWDASQLIKDEQNQILRRLLVSRIIDRASPSLDVALRATAYLIEEQVEMFKSDDLELVLISLDYLSEETQLKQENMAVLRQEARTAKSDIRAAASKFVKSLLRYANTSNLSTMYLHNHPTIQKWEVIGRNDPLPEVRQPWEEAEREE